MQNNILLVKNLKNTESAQLWTNLYAFGAEKTVSVAET